MPAFADWLHGVLTDGESVQPDSPDPTAADHPTARKLLSEAFADASLDLAGPPLPFEPDTALAAARLLAVACWRVATGETTPLPAVREPTSPAAHLSADVTLRFLPSVHRRARAVNTPLAEELAEVLRRFPLSGVLADLDGSPVKPPAFDHVGLTQLYADRLTTAPRARWLPPLGPGREWAEKAFADRNRPLPIDTGEHRE